MRRPRSRCSPSAGGSAPAHRTILPAVPEPLSIAQVTPYPWEDRHDVNTFVARVSDELALRGHRVIVVAPSSSRTLVRESRRAVRNASIEPAPGEVRVLAVGEALPPLPGRRRAALPIDVARTISDLFESAALDLCHVHEPFAPSVASTALRHSRALNVGTFHAPTERVVATQVARKVVQLVFGRLDARTALRVSRTSAREDEGATTSTRCPRAASSSETRATNVLTS